ncbi:MAG: ABC transporter ATP-binding protein, partial [Microgenomates group bacterium]
MAKIAIKAEHIGKVYWLNQAGRYYDLRDLIVDTPQRILNGIKNRNAGRDEFRALDDVSFSVPQGQV